MDSFLSLLDGVRRTSRGWQARCPAHGDKSPSLSTREAEDGKILVYCFAGCTRGEICAALRIQTRDLFPSHDPEQVRATQQERQRRKATEQQARERLGHWADLHREYESVIASAYLGEIGGLDEERLDAFIDAVGKAHNALRKEMGEEAYAEWSVGLGTRNGEIKGS